MKRLVTILLCQLCALLCVHGADLSNSEVNAKWRTTKISVKGGGVSPDVMTLLKAFHHVLPTWVTGAVIKHGENLKDGGQYVSDDDWRVLVDRQNGYADLASETDIDQMQTCVWKCDNGHRLFAVSLYEQHDPVQNLLCWYDYDPATETLSPDESPVDRFKSKHHLQDIGWSLPMQGTEFTISEYDPSLPTITHVYQWNGLLHFHTIDRIESVDYQWFGSATTDKKPIKMMDEGWQYYTILDLTGDGCKVLWLNKSEMDVKDSRMIASYKSGFSCIGSRCSQNPPGVEELYISTLEEKGSNVPTVVLCTQDAPGGQWYTIIRNGHIDGFVSSIPNVLDPSVGRVTRVIDSFGDEKELLDILTKEVEDYPLRVGMWQQCEIVE